jgi:hypothetical protein
MRACSSRRWISRPMIGAGPRRRGGRWQRRGSASTAICTAPTLRAAPTTITVCPRDGQLVQKRFPVGWHPACGSRSGLILWMRMRRKQIHTFDRDHPLLLVIVEPILTRLEAGYDRMPRCRRMLGCMLTRRTVTASDVPTFRTATEMKPPTFR